MSVRTDRDGTDILAHNMYDADAGELRFQQFIGSLRLAHDVRSAALINDDPATIMELRKSGISAEVRLRLRDIEANLLVPPGMFRDEIEPFFPLFQATAAAAEDVKFGIAWL